MPLPISRSESSPSISSYDGLTRTETKELTRRQNAEIARGLVVSTRVQAAGLVAATGLQLTGMLSREASLQADGDPALSNRVNFIVDRYAEFVSNEVARFGFQ